MAADQHNAVDKLAQDTAMNKCECGGEPRENTSKDGVSIECSNCDNKTDSYAERSAAVSFWNMQLWAETGFSTIKDKAINLALQIIREANIDASEAIVMEAAAELIKAVDESKYDSSRYAPVIRSSIKIKVQEKLSVVSKKHAEAAQKQAQAVLPDAVQGILVSYVPRVFRDEENAQVEISYGKSPDIVEALTILACVGNEAAKILDDPDKRQALFAESSGTTDSEEESGD